MKITGINKDKSGTYDGRSKRYLTTDERITEEWAEIFRDRVSPPFTAMNNDISIFDGYIVVECEWNDLQSEIDKIKRLCAATDAELIRQHLEAEREAQDKRKKQEDEKNRAHAFYDGLNFD